MASLVATVPRALVWTVLGGASISIQAYINGRLGRELDSVAVAAAINNLIAVLLALGVVLATGALGRGRARLRAAGRRPPAWQFLGGLVGAGLVGVTAAAAPVVGVALVTVAIVCGSTVGSLPVDAAGLGPSGRRAITTPRLAGVLLAITATIIGAIGARGQFEPLLLGLALVAGLGIPLQAAANGQLARGTGEPFLASLVNSSVGLAVLALVAGVAVAIAPPEALPRDPLLYLGGLCGAFVVVVGAAAVQTLGVLRLGLAIVAGQTLGALAVDLVAPVPGEGLTAGTVLGVLLTLVAVWVSGRGRVQPPAGDARIPPGA